MAAGSDFLGAGGHQVGSTLHGAGQSVGHMFSGVGSLGHSFLRSFTGSTAWHLARFLGLGVSLVVVLVLVVVTARLRRPLR